MTVKPSERRAWQLSALAGSVAVIVLLVMGTDHPVAAQSTPNVIVDLSVLDTPGGYGAYPAPTYGAPPAYSAPQGYVTAPVYGAPPAYGAARAYPPPAATAQSGLAYGGYLVVPNSGFGPPQPTMLMPSPQVPTGAFAAAPRQAAPTQLVPAAPPAAPTTATAQAPAVKPPPPAMPAPPAAAKVAPTVPAAPPALAVASQPTEPPPAEGSADPADSESELDAPAAETAATIDVPPTPIVQPAQPKAPPSASPAEETAAAPDVSVPPPAAEVPPPPAPAEQVQVAARTPSSQATDDGTLSIRFAPGSAELENGVALEAVATQLSDDENLRVRLVAYADGGDEDASKARRLSLSRALAVRGHLIKLGVRSTRMDVRALGNKVEGGDPDRVDVMVVTR